ncbi:hydrolase [Paraoerskovia sediminicola]|uniref:Hydrolase n=1 Tax=Paraoerskovia sediminicola TaxID=1138587 RepID=A0ABN6XC13_9CELL|nr:HAD-IB family hydrolase [Paraoerskovia sediminicola]BDZ41310.1 hydrolase [Paraoerskovia sediminicola]
MIEDPADTQDAPGSQDPGTPRVAAFFDVDNTIIRGASAAHLARALYQREFFGIRDLWSLGLHHLRYMTLGENRRQINTVRSRALSIVAGHTVAEIVAIGEEVYDQVLELRIFPGTKRLLDEHVAAGHEVWLVSATPIEIGTMIARRLGANGALGSVAESEGGVYTGALVGDMMHGRHKAAGVAELAARRGIDLDESFAYGDSMNDLTMMQTVGHPCAINPEPRLRRHAAQVGWPVREFRGRPARAARSGAKTLSLAGAVWAGALVVRQIGRTIRGR